MSSTVTPASTPGSEPPSPTPTATGDSGRQSRPREKRSWRRIILLTLTCVLALAVIGRVILAVAFPHVLRKVAAAYDLDASYSRLELYFLSGDVGLWDLTVRPRAGGAPLMTTEYVRADVSTLNLLRGKLVVSRAELDGMNLDVEREADGRIPALEKLLAGGADAPASDEKARELSLDPPLRVDAVRVNRLRAHWVDRSVTPPVDTELEMTLRLSDVGVAGRPTRLLVEGTSPPLLDTLRVEGTATARGRHLDANLDVLVRGLHPRPAAGYLAPIGIRPVAESITLTAVTEIKADTRDAALSGAGATTRPVHVAGTVTLRNISAGADGQEAAGVDRIVIEADAISGAATKLSKVTIDGVRANASRTREGNIRFAGLELAAPVPSTRPALAAGSATAAEPAPTKAPQAPAAPTTQPGGAPLALALGELTIRDVRAAFSDEAVTPVAKLALLADRIAVTGVDSEQPDAPVQITGAFSSPGMARSVRLDGTLRPFASTRMLDAKLVAQGIRPEAIRGYLDALGVESTLSDGTLQGDLRADVGVAADGTIRADARLENVALADGAAGELLALDAAHVSGVTIDADGKRLRVEAVDLAGPRFAARRAADGTVAAVGLRTRPIGTAKATEPMKPAASPPSTVASSPATSSPPEASTSPPPLPRLELGRLTWKGVDVQLVDQAVTPATNVRIQNAGVELADIVIDLDRRAPAAAPGKVRAWVSAAGVAEALNVDGTVAPAAGAVTADLNITGKGLRGDLLAPYLKAAGIDPALRDGSLQMRTRVSLTQQSDDVVAAAVAVESLSYADGGQELVGLERLAVDGLSLTPEGLAVASVQLDKPRARAQRNEDGSLNVAGIRLNVPSTRPATAEAAASPPPASSPQTPSPASAAFVATLGKLRVNEGSLTWTDRAVAPAVNAVGRASVEVDNFVFGRDAAPATVKLIATLDQTLEQFTAAGVVSPSVTAPMVRLDLAGSGIRQGVLAPYLPPGVNVALADGRFRATLEAGIAPQPQGGHSAKLIVSAVDYRDGEAPQPLLAFDSARVLVSRADMPGKVVSIDEVSLNGLQTSARKAADGSVHALGVRLASPAAPAAPAPEVSGGEGAPPARLQPAAALTGSAASTQPSGSTDVGALIAAGREKPPLITLKTLAVNLRRVSYADESRPKASPVALADVTLRNRSPIELLGDDPQSRPPVDLELLGRVDPLVGRFNVSTQVAPFASQPTLQVSVTATGISGAGVTAVLPELREQIDGAPLTDGRFAASIEATARVARRGPAALDFSRPMEVAAVVRDVAFRGDGSQGSPVLAGVQEVRADGVRIDPATGAVVARSIEISRPIARAWRDADGIHALGLVIRTPATQPAAAEPSTVPAESPKSPEQAVITSAAGRSDGEKGAEGGVAPAKPQAELTIEKLTVIGIDVNIEDRSVDPPLVVPLNSLEAEVRGLSNLAFHERRPIRFNVTAGAGKVPLGADRPSREMFSEVAASGNVTLHPAPRGWARSTVSGLEMLSLKGPAAASKVTIDGGVFDSRVDVRFQDDGSLDTRSRFAFTDLRMSEPEDGAVRRVLKLPGPLDAMIILLQDASGAITVPINVTVEENSVGGGQIAGAAVSALGSILATAMASAPLKVAGGMTQLVGIEQGIPGLGGGKKKQTGPQAAGAVEFYAGADATVADSATVTLAQLIERMRADRGLEVTLRHELGGGDIARAAERANPSPDAAAALGAFLRQRKAALLQQREHLASAARATIFAGPAAAAPEAIKQLRELEAQVAATEDALDRVYELTRPGAERQAERRTRAASLEIAEARLNAMKELIVAAGIPDADSRVRVIKPQFTPADGDAGGKVTMVVTSKKKP